MITAEEARRQVLVQISCEDELDEIEYNIKKAISDGELHASVVLRKMPDSKLTKLEGILKEKGYRVTYHISKHDFCYLNVSW